MQDQPGERREDTDRLRAMSARSSLFSTRSSPHSSVCRSRVMVTAYGRVLRRGVRVYAQERRRFAYETQDILVLPRGPAVGACSLHLVPPLAAAMCECCRHRFGGDRNDWWTLRRVRCRGDLARQSCGGRRTERYDLCCRRETLSAPISISLYLSIAVTANNT